jgi:hypothetical protein
MQERKVHPGGSRVVLGEQRRHLSVGAAGEPESVHREERRPEPRKNSRFVAILILPTCTNADHDPDEL